MTEDEDADPVGAPEPHAGFMELAEKVCLIRLGDPLDQNVIDFANGVVAMCERKHIRAELLD